MDSTLKIIDISGVPKTSRSEVHVVVVESSSPHVGRFVGNYVASSKMVKYTPTTNLYFESFESKVVMNTESFFAIGVTCG